MKDYFSILQVSEDASRDDIQRAYRRLAKQYHPDVNKSSDAHERFCAITEAYEFLMEYWPRHAGQYAGSESYQQKYDEHRQTDVYESFQREARERAQRMAHMRYEKFKKQHEAFQESGINDIALLLTIILRLFSVMLFLFLFLTPIILTIVVHWSWIFAILFMWPFAVGIGWYYYDNRKNYFLPRKFYYNPERIKHLFTDIYPTTQHCYYCPRKYANSRSYNLDLFRLKEIKLHLGGFRQQQVNYLNDSVSISIPRSQKAFIIHTMNVLIKIFSITGCLIFLDISSMVWRLVFGIALGGMMSRVLLTLTGTKSSVTYLISYGLVFRVIMWLLCIGLTSRFYYGPFDITTNEYIYPAVTAVIIFDSFIMQLLSMVLGKYASKPITAQYPETTARFDKGYSAYNDIPVLSVIYPLFRWIIG